MDLLAPNPLIMRTGFIQLGIVVILFLVAALKRSSATTGLPLWAKMNAPLVSLLIGEAWALLAYFLFRAAPSIDEYFIVGIWMAGGATLIAGIGKDVGDGSIGVTSPGDVAKMRAENPRHGGIGG